MQHRKWSRRYVLKTSTTLAAAALFAEPVKAAAPPPTSVTPALIEDARKEGQDLVLLRTRAKCRRAVGQEIA